MVVISVAEFLGQRLNKLFLVEGKGCVLPKRKQLLGGRVEVIVGYEGPDVAQQGRHLTQPLIAT